VSPFRGHGEGDARFVTAESGRVVVREEGDALELIGACTEHSASGVLLDADQLDARFFDLKTGLAGAIIQKLVNYRARLAVLLPADFEQSERFKELLLESKRGRSRSFRAFESREAALAWLAES
jgi:hypothetical protein